MRNLGFKRRFFDRWRTELVGLMTLIDSLPEGDLYYYQAPFSIPSVWVVAGSTSVLVAYSEGESPKKIREQAAIWGDALRNKDLPEREYALAGHPVYIAELDSKAGHLRVVMFRPGDWAALAECSLPKEWTQLPKGWPEGHRERILALAAQRIDCSGAEMIFRDTLTVAEESTVKRYWS